MKHLKITLATLLLATMIIACGKSDRYSSESDAYTTSSPSAPPGATGDAVMRNSDESFAATGTSGDIAMNRTDSIASMMTSSAASGSPNMDTSHQFIRNASVRFRVNEVRSATFSIEAITAKFGGYVAYTDLQSTINDVKNTKVSDDSTLVTTYYTVSNNMTLRIPAENLDSTLRTLGTLVAYLDFRRIEVTDATLMILRERLAARRIAYSTTRLEDAADGSDAKLRDRAAVEEALYNKQTMADESLLRTLELKDQIRLSTVTLHIYQRQAWTQEMVANEKSIDAYRPGFFHDLGEAIAKGWAALKTGVIALAHFWPLFVIILIGIFVIRLILRRQKKG